ncbi:TPA: hypothetical protein ACH3X2_001349 [Trebouxia sp. C0005]
MKDLFVVGPKSHRLPVQPHLPPESWLGETLSLMAKVSRQLPEHRVVWNFSGSDLSFEHVKFMALWLQVPDTRLKLYALDLSFNRISVPDWASFVPLVDTLSRSVQYMFFEGNRLPAIIQDPLLQTAAFEKVSLGIAEHPLAQNAWADSWTIRARHFQQQVYGQPFRGSEGTMLPTLPLLLRIVQLPGLFPGHI